MPRTPPEQTPEQQKAHERLSAIANLDLAALRAWAERYKVELFGDDHLLLISMHEARAWLRAHHPESVVLKQITQFPREFRGSSYRT